MRQIASQFERTVQSTVMRRLGVCAIFVTVLLLCMTCLCAGCAGVCIVDVASSSVIVRRDSGTFREEPLYISDDGFLTLKRTETNTFVLIKVGFDGKERGQTALPLFHRGYGGDDYAFSDDGKLFAYIERVGDSSVRRLYVNSVLKPTINLIPSGLCNSLPAFLGYMVFWVDSSTVLLYAKNAGVHFKEARKENIGILHLKDMSVSWLPGYYNSYGGAILLSPSKRFLLASEEIEDSVPYRMHIIDLKSEKETGVVMPSGSDMNDHGAVWSSDDEIIYAVDNVVYAVKIGSSDKKEILRMKPKRGIRLYAVDCKRNLHYQIFDDSGGYTKTIGGWRIYNLDTKEDKELTGKQINGKVIVNRKRDKIVAPVGY